jgi:hypothetical protein
MNKNELKLSPIRTKDGNFYIYHIVNSAVTYVYDIKNHFFMLFVKNQIIRQFDVVMTKEQFEIECKNSFMISIIANGGLN